MAQASVLLPQPDSPTTPSARPRKRSKDTPSSARASPAAVGKATRRPRTRNSASVMAVTSRAGVERPLRGRR